MRSTRQAPALGWALFSYVLLVTLVITLFPFRFQWPERIHFLWFGGWSDTLLNVLFFLPLGFLYKLIRPEDSIHEFLDLDWGSVAQSKWLRFHWWSDSLHQWTC